MINAYLADMHGYTWVELTYNSVAATGRIQPRLVFSFYATLQRQNVTAQLVYGEAKLLVGNERLGSGACAELGETIPFGLHGNKVLLHFELALSREALRYIEEQLRGHTLAISLELRMLLNLRDDNEHPITPSTYPLREWFLLSLKPTTVQIPIARSDWVKHILEPLGVGTYVLMEVRIPDVPQRQRWEKALAHLQRAEELFLNGDDPGVLSACRAAFEQGAMEGAPQHIFDKIQDERKRKVVDDLVKQCIDYFHLGRHVSKAGPDQGDFPIDHRDAEFALGLAKMLLSYSALLLVETS
jgi:hypothetical protein